MDLKKEAARAALGFIKKNTLVGLGDGNSVLWLAHFLIEDIKQGLSVQLCTSSERTKQFLQEAGIQPTDLSTINSIDQYFDGCDQIDSGLNVNKSGAGIHTMEKLFASMANDFIILADASKWVHALDTAYPIVIEVIPQGKNFVLKEIKKIFPGTDLQIRISDDEKNNVITVNGNYLTDCRFLELPDLKLLYTQCKNITGVVELSLFYQMVNYAIIADVNETSIYKRENDLVSKYNYTTQQNIYENTHV